MTDAWMPGAERLTAEADGGRLKGGAPRVVWLVLNADPVTLPARAAAERLIELGRPAHLVWNPYSGDLAQLIPAVRAGRALGWADGPRWGPRSAGWGPGPGAGQPGWGTGCGWAEVPDRGPGPGKEGQDRAGNSDWTQQAGWARSHGWAPEPERAPEPDWIPASSWTHGADWTQDVGWTHGRGLRQLAGAMGPPAMEPLTPPARDGLAGVNNEGRLCVQIAVIGHAWAPFTDGPMAGVHEIVSWLDSWHVARGWPAGHPAPFPGLARSGQQRRRHWSRGGHFGASQVPGCSGAGPGAIDIERLTGPLTAQPGASVALRSGSPARISAMT